MYSYIQNIKKQVPHTGNNARLVQWSIIWLHCIALKFTEDVYSWFTAFKHCWYKLTIGQIKSLKWYKPENLDILVNELSLFTQCPLLRVCSKNCDGHGEMSLFRVFEIWSPYSNMLLLFYLSRAYIPSHYAHLHL